MILQHVSTGVTIILQDEDTLMVHVQRVYRGADFSVC